MYRSSRPIFFGLALAIATPGPSSAEKLPVFKLAEAQADPEHARALLAKLNAGQLPAETKAVERSGVVGFRAGNTMVEIETASGGIFAANLDQLWNPRLTPRLLGRSEARQQADTFLSENGLLPREDAYVRISEPVYSESGVAPDAPGGKKTLLDIQVNYQVSIAVGNRQVPVVGGGGEFKVAMGEAGAIIGYAGAWRPVLGVASEEETLSQAAAEAQYRASVSGIKLAKVETSLAYYSAPSFKSQAYLAPVWVVKAMGELKGRQLPLRQAIIAATKFGPSFPVIPAKPRSTGPRLAGIDDAPREGATSWIGPSQGLGGSPANAQGFVNGLAAHGWNINFNFGEANAWAAPNGPIIHATAMYAHMGDHATRNDHMHGAGFVVWPDPVGPAQQRHLLWSGT